MPPSAHDEASSPEQSALTKPAPMSYAQARIWLINQISGPDPQYNVPYILRCWSAVDADCLRAALRDVVLRHEILRTSYHVVAGEPSQAVLSASAIGDLLSVEQEREHTKAARIVEVSAHPFDLAREIPIRAWLLTSDPGSDVVVLVVHHIAVDGASMSPLLRDLETAYLARRRNVAPPWRPLRIQYSDYAAWQQRDFLGDSADPGSLSGRQLAYWRTKLAGLPVETRLPADRPRPRAMTNDGAVVASPLSAHLNRRLIALSRAEHVTPLTLLRAAIAAFLGRMGAGTDVPLAGFVTGRSDAAFDDLVGFFVNTLVFRVDSSGDPTFRELLRRVRAVEIEAVSHQDVPFDLVVKELKPPRSATRHPLAQVALSYDPPLAFPIPGLDAELEVGDNSRAKFDLHALVVAEHDSEGDPTKIRMSWRYATALFDPPTVVSLAGRFVEFLDSVVTEPDRRIGMGPAAQRTGTT
jgi:hypothetical protein